MYSTQICRVIAVYIQITMKYQCVTFSALDMCNSEHLGFVSDVPKNVIELYLLVCIT